ncbi:MAG: DUF2855 family protein [Pseudomonadota bacterium]|nr:DUF2855 family protein [Pseudomonadota bacterium]
MTTTFAVERANLRRTRWLDLDARPIEVGAVRMRIDRFSFTSNNVTYAAFGEAMHYWDFYPTAELTLGCIPVWGFATVSESRCVEVDLGERFYGYFPMADEVALQPAHVSERGFVDAAPRRRELAIVYNQYLRCRTDPFYREDEEALIALLRPLFITSFLIDDFLHGNALFGARQILISSASSKTAYGLAFCLGARGQATGSATVVGLTSPSNAEFTCALDCYDDVWVYEDASEIDIGAPTVYVDMSGDAGVRAAVHGRLQERLVYSCSVGGTHWQELGTGKGLLGPRPVLFFAPAQVKKRLTDWGSAGLDERVDSAWRSFIARLSDAKWLEVVEGRGRDAVESTYAALLAGNVPAREGRVLSL